MLPYAGITVILNRPSRFDKSSLLDINSKSGEFFTHQFSKVGISRAALNIQSSVGWDAKGKPLPEDTKCILALGEEAHYMLNVENTRTTLNENRGAPYYYRGIPVISTFAPQDSYDMQNYEDEFHGLDDDEGEDNDKSFGKSHGKTSRKNYRFWLTRDIRKCFRISQEGVIKYNADYTIFPSMDDLLDILKKYKNHYLHIDIETDPETLDITCFAFAYEDPITTELVTPVFIVPIRRWYYACSYENPAEIFSSLAMAFKSNIVVTHNGHQFDLFVFAYKYRVPWGRQNWDTMIAFHRLFPEIEKSLGHGLSLFTDLPYHKNEGVFRPFNIEQEQQLWKYCGKDVFGMYEMRKQQELYGRKIGATESMAFGNSLIPLYLTETFTGIRKNAQATTDIIVANELRITEVTKILYILVGRELNVKSPPQMKVYLYGAKDKGGLGLQPFFYGKVSKKTGKASPKADAKSLLKLQVKHGLASIAVILELRRLHKQTSSLKINYWNPYGECAITDKEIVEPKDEDDDDE